MAALAGCAVAQPSAQHPSPRPLGVALPAYTAPDSRAGEPLDNERLASEPRGEVTLGDALAAALLRNPDLAAFSWEIRARQARALQAGLHPNPEIALEVENIGGSGDFDGADLTETTLALGQRIELGGKRTKRRRVADLDAALAGWDYEVKRVAVFSEVARDFAGVLAAQEQLELTNELVELAGQSLASVRRQVSAGATSSVEHTRAEVAFASQQIDRQRADAALVTARLRLAALWASGEAHFGSARGDLHELSPSPSPSLSVLLARLDNSPELARWTDEIARHEAVVALEDSKRTPDVTASAGLRQHEESNDTALVFSLSMPFPVYDRNQGGRFAARRDLAKARHLWRAARVRIETALRVSWGELSSSLAEVLALREGAVPRAEAAHRGVREGYLRGLFRFVDVLDAQRTLFELRARELDALRRYHGAVAEIERLTGAPLAEPAPPDRNAPATEGAR